MSERISGIQAVSGSGATALVNVKGTPSAVMGVHAFMRGTGATGTISFQSGSAPVEAFPETTIIDARVHRVTVTDGIVYLLK